MKTELVFIRHGEPVLKNAFLGRTDSPLTDNGWSQLRQTFEHIGELDCLISSPLARCCEFAQVVAKQRQWKLEARPEWQECQFGDWDGLTFDEIDAKWPDSVRQYFSDPASVTPPKGESLADFSGRVEGAIQKVLNDFPGKRVGILCHSGVIRTVIAWCLKLEYAQALHIYRLAIDYASVTRVWGHLHGGKVTPQLMTMNWQPEFENN